MKSCLGILIVFFTFVAVVGGAGLIWYLSHTSEFSRKGVPAVDTATTSASGPTPQATPKAPETR
jgi:flagellar basal body-associated protein FliL